MTRKKKILERPLTEVELELMNALWDLGRCTVKDVHAFVLKTREVAYTTVATMMKVLEQKKLVESEKGERTLSFRAILSRADYETSSLRHLADHVFRGGPTSMVMRLLDDRKISADELRSIREMLDRRIGR